MLIYIFFYIFILFLAILVISSYNPIHSLFFLILLFIFSSLLLFFLQLEFFALIFLIIYIGAILVLFLLVIMMLNLKQIEFKIFIFSYISLAFFIFFCICCELIYLKNYFLYFDKIFQQINIGYLNNNFNLFFMLKYIDQNFFLINQMTTAHFVGLYLYTYYSLIFIICGLILFFITMGIILLTYVSYIDKNKNFFFKYYQKNTIQYYVEYSNRLIKK